MLEGVVGILLEDFNDLWKDEGGYSALD